MRINDLIELYRVNDWWYYLGFILLGIFLTHSTNPESLIEYLSVGFLLLAYAFSLNDFFDEGSRNKKYFLFPLFLLLPLLLFLNVFQVFLSLSFLAIFTLYSAEPWRFKAKPFISSLFNGLGFSILFLLPFSSFTRMNTLFFSFFFCLNMVAQFIHEVTDLEEDRKSGITTTAIHLGKKNLRIVCCIFLLSSSFPLFLLYHYGFVSLLFTMVALSFVLFFVLKISVFGMTKDLRREYKRLGILVGLFFLFIVW